MRWVTAMLGGAAALSATGASAQARPDQRAFLDLYRQLVETNTSLSVGSCTQAAAQIAGRLTDAGYFDLVKAYGG